MQKQHEILKGTRLSHQQARLWALQRESLAYRAQCAVNVGGLLNVSLLQQALQDVAHRHKILQTRFHILPGMEIPVQVIDETIRLSCSMISLEGLDGSRQATLQDTYFIAMQEEPFDLRNGVPMHVLVLRMSAHRHTLLLCLPALYADASSLKLFVAELQRAYLSCLQGETPVFDEEQLQYAEFSLWQSELLQETDSEEERAFWRKFDLSSLAAIRLPFEQDRDKLRRGSGLKVNRSFAPGRVEVPIEPAVYRQIQALAQRYNVSCEAFLLACWQIVFWRLTDVSPLMGVVCDGRPYEDLASLPGLCAQVVPLNTELDGDLSFEYVLMRVESSLKEIVEEQLYFTWQQTSADQKHLFFPASFEFDSWSSPPPSGELTFALTRCSCCTEPFVTKLKAFVMDEALHLEVHYDPLNVQEKSVQRLASVLGVLLRNALVRPSAAIGSLPLLSLDQQQRLQNSLTGPLTPLPTWTFHSRFEAQVECVPNQIAIICGAEQLTYLQLNQQANRLSHFLRREGVGPDVLVGLCMERSVQMLVGLLAILKAGGAYVPLDPDQPSKRLCSLLNETAPLLVLTQERLASRLAAWGGRLLCTDNKETAFAAEQDTNPDVGVGPQNLVYIIYTSGSTGSPKGVMIRHRGVSNYIYSLCELLAKEPGLHFATVSTLAADLGNTAIFCALASGGCLHVLPYETITSGDEFARYVHQHPIDILKIVPSHFSALLDTGQGGAILPRKYLVLGGEPLTESLLARLRAMKCSCCVINHYGPTEATIGVLVNVLGRTSGGLERQRGEWEIVPVGHPIANTEAYILDRHRQLVPIGIPGELYIGGAGLAAGYLHQPELTRERFVSLPFAKEEGLFFYRTGDVVCCTEDGVIEFVGRTDNQVKVRGYRIELGEIEAALRRHTNVRECVVTLREHVPGEKQLIAYIVVKRQPQTSSREIRSFLAEELPEYMLPVAFVFLKVLPLTLNGKVDRKALPAPQDDEGQERVTYVAPGTPIEEIVVGVWQEVLKVSPIGMHDNFADLGGHSLLATQIVSRLRLLLQVDIPLRMLFETPTVASFAKRVEGLFSHISQRAIPLLMPAVRTQSLPLSFAQQRLWFLNQLEPGSAAYHVPNAVQLSGRLDIKALRQSLAALIQRHEILRTTFQENAGHPVQVIGKAETFHLPLADLRILESEQRAVESMRLIVEEARYPFDLTRGPLLRAALIRLGDDEHILLLTMHHIISDGWSMGIFIRELTTLYRAFHEGKPSPLTDLSIQYADYALWQRQWLQGEALQEQISYWTKQLERATPLELPTDYPRTMIQSTRGAGYSFSLPSGLSQELVALSRREGVTLFMTLLAAFQVLLYRYTGTYDVVVGTDIANRAYVETEQLIGFFVNLLALRVDLSGKPLFRNVLQRVRNMVLDAYAHQDIPFEMVIENLRIERRANQVPLVRVLFVLQNVPRTYVELPDLRMRPFTEEIASAKFDLAVFLSERPEGLHGMVNYSTDLFKEQTIATMMKRFEVLLDHLSAQPETPVDVAEIYSDEEKKRKEQEMNDKRQFKQKGLRTSKREAVDLSGLDQKFLEGEPRA